MYFFLHTLFLFGLTIAPIKLVTMYYHQIVLHNGVKETLNDVRTTLGPKSKKSYSANN